MLCLLYELEFPSFNAIPIYDDIVNTARNAYSTKENLLYELEFPSFNAIPIYDDIVNTARNAYSTKENKRTIRMRDAWEN
ncbi:hypothetical protein QE152_g25169 [Popillia japonica]|uniref:Uncharacterized protein n=1 Tax=Popillia japonica TaxID=7064 RepID=A0AAW1K2Z1_POPJA